MPRGTVKTRNKFQTLMLWIGDSDKKPGEAYEQIRTRLITIFYARGCRAAEELADETIERVTNKIETLIDTYMGDPRLYFYGVAKNVFREHLRKPVFQKLPRNLRQKSETQDPEHLERRSRCLAKCLKQLPEEERKFILDYYRGDHSKRIRNRKELKDKLNLSSQAMRVKAFRIRAKLYESMCADLYEHMN